jgi:hypothetical protein
VTGVGRPVVSPAALFVVALWLGAVILFAAAVAPAAFRVLPTRTLAGALVSATLPMLFWSGAIIALVMLLLTLIGHAPGARRAVVGVAAVVMLASTLAAQTIVAPRIERLRSALPSSLEMLAAGDPRRAEFGRLHGVSVALLGAAALAAAVIAGAGLVAAGRGQ